MLDVLVAGAGPAGSMAAIVLARAGARVVIVDRDAFPRDKLCGDTLNPGAVALLRSLDVSGGALDRGLPLTGMRISGPGAAVDAPYAAGASGLAIPRRQFDQWLLEEAVRAGAKCETGLQVVAPLSEGLPGGLPVRGLVLRERASSRQTRMPASIVIAADGRRSVLARALGLSTQPGRIRRWAFGTYATGVADMTSAGEMHIRRWGYCGFAPMPDGTTNVCVVTGPRPAGRSPLEVMRTAIAQDWRLAARISGARFDRPVRVLGPLAIDVAIPGADGVLLAGDAAGFVDPMTGDGLHLALRGALLAAREALGVLEHGDYLGAPLRLAQARQDLMGGKLRFNRALRSLVASPAAVRMAGWGAAIAPAVVRRAVRYAGDAP